MTFGSIFNKMISVHGTMPSRPEEEIEGWEAETEPIPIGRVLAEAISDDIPNDYRSFSGDLSRHCGYDISYTPDQEQNYETAEYINLPVTEEVCNNPINNDVIPEECGIPVDFTKGTVFPEDNHPSENIVEEVHAVLSGIVTTVEDHTSAEKRQNENPQIENRPTVQPSNHLTAKHPMREPCGCQAKKCSIEEEKRTLIHQQYWTLDAQERKMWLSCYCKFHSPKRRYSASNENGTRRRKVSRELFLPVNGKEVSVCQKMFLGTLGFSTDKALQTLQKTKTEVGVVIPDQRGKHPPKHKITEEDRNFIIQHILKFKPCISHYRREHAPNRLYLPSELDISEMYQDYENDCKERGWKSLGYISYYRQVKAMNISFASLGCEECELCDGYRIHIEESTKENTDSTEVVRKKTKKSKEVDENAETTSESRKKTKRTKSTATTNKGREKVSTPTTPTTPEEVKMCSDDCEICIRYKKTQRTVHVILKDVRRGQGEIFHRQFCPLLEW